MGPWAQGAQGLGPGPNLIKIVIWSRIVDQIINLLFLGKFLTEKRVFLGEFRTEKHVFLGRLRKDKYVFLGKFRTEKTYCSWQVPHRTNSATVVSKENCS